MIDRNQILLLELLQASIFGATPNIPADIDWDAVFQEAEAQTVTGLVAAAVPQGAAGNWKEVEDKCKMVFIRIMHGQTQLMKILRQADIPVVILKGTAAAMYYPAPFRRMMGDVDFLVSQDKFERTVHLMEAKEYRPFHELQSQLDMSGSPRHIEFSRDGIEYELHHHFSGNGIDIENSLVNGLSHPETAQIGGVSFPVLPPIENGVLLLAHVAFHLKSCELGLRQVIDWMMFVNSVLDDSTWENSFSKLAEDAGLKKLAIVLTRLCRDYLGLPGDRKWCNEADERLVNNLLELILERGNFGRKLEEPHTVEKYMGEVKNNGIISFLKLISNVVWNSSAVQNSRVVLRPFMLISEFIRRTGKRLKERPEHLLEDVNRGKEISQLYKDLGL